MYTYVRVYIYILTCEHLQGEIDAASSQTYIDRCPCMHPHIYMHIYMPCGHILLHVYIDTKYAFTRTYAHISCVFAFRQGQSMPLVPHEIRIIGTCACSCACVRACLKASCPFVLFFVRVCMHKNTWYTSHMDHVIYAV